MATIVRRLEMPLRTWRLEPAAVQAAAERLWRRRGIHEVLAVSRAFALSPAEAGRLFGVSRQAVNAWLRAGVPTGRLADVGRVAQVARALSGTFRAERLPQIVRSPLPALGGRSVLEALAAEGPLRVLELVERLRSFVPAA